MRMSWMLLKMTTKIYGKYILYKSGQGVERVVAVWTPLPRRQDQVLWTARVIVDI